MNAFILGNEPVIRLGFFFGVFLAVAAAEMLVPKRSLLDSKPKRWANNLGITVLNTVALRLVFAAGAVKFALIARERGWGLLNIVDAPAWSEIAFAVLALDFTIYLQHMAFHHLPLLWKLHKMHHTDLDLDVTTGARFHPLEILLSMCIKISAVFFLGAPAISVIIFEVALNAASMFNHGNIHIPEKIDRLLRLLIVTPDMHRVHHSVIIKEFNSNFGFYLPWWDRILGTYKAQPVKGHDAMTIGLARHRDPSRLNLPSLLILPFRKIQ